MNFGALNVRMLVVHDCMETNNTHTRAHIIHAHILIYISVRGYEVCMFIMYVCLHVRKCISVQTFN